MTCPTCDDRGTVPAGGHGGDGYDPCPDCGYGDCRLCARAIALRATNTGPVVDWHHALSDATTCAGSLEPPKEADR